MAEVVSLAASIAGLVELAFKIVGYFNAVKAGEEEKGRLRDEISSASFLLLMLKDRTSPSSPNATSLQTATALASRYGPLNQFKECLELVADKIAGGSGKGRLRSAVTSMSWPFKKSEITQLLASLERQKALFNLALQDDHLSLSLAMSRSMEALEHQVDQVLEKVDLVRDEQQAILEARTIDEKKCILKWISELDFWVNQDDTLRRRHKDTGNWIVNAPVFQEWISCCGRTIWCPGIPGAGKTILAAIVVDHIRRAFPSETTAVACIYFNYRDQEKQNIPNVIGALLKQLVESRQGLSPEMKKAYEQHRNGQSRLGKEELSSLLRSEVSYFQRLFVIIDALDEASETNGIRAALLSDLNGLNSAANIFITSRPIPSIAEQFQGQLSLDIRADDEDVRAYIQGRLQNGPNLLRHISADPNLKVDIENAIVKKVHGMFLLAELHLNSLSGHDNRRALKKALESLPTDYDTTFGKAMEQIRQQGTKAERRARQVLSWITHSRRALSIREIQHALAVEVGDQEFYEDAIIETSHLISVCCGLVSADEGSTVIRLVHYTLEEYFTKMKGELFPGSADEITNVCLTYLSFDAFGLGPAPTDEAMGTRLRDYPFLQYASEEWGRHASEAIESQTLEAIHVFLGQELIISAAVQAMITPAERWSPNSKLWSQRFPTGVSALWLAAYYGLTNIVATLPEKGAQVDQEDGWGWTPLFVATENAHIAAAKLLLGSGASITRADINGDSVLHIAARMGNLDLVSLYREMGANVNQCNHEGETVLHEAAWGEAVDVCKALVDWGVDTQVVDKNGCTPLHQAAQEGSEAITNMLIEKGLDVFHKDNQGASVLLKAVLNGHLDIVRLLVKHGALVNEVYPQYRTHEYRDSKFILCERKVGGTAVHAASYKGHQEILETLLQHAGDAQATNSEGATTLYEAAAFGHASVVAVLLRAGADPSTLSRAGVTPLFAACKGGHDAAVAAILDANERISATEKDIAAAAEHAYSKASMVVKTLLEKRPQSQITETVLRAAARADEKLWSTLVEFDSTIRLSESVMMGMVDSHHVKEVCTLLCDKGIPFEVTDQVVGSALKSWKGQSFFQAMLDQGKRLQVTEATLAITFESEWAGLPEGPINFLLDHAEVVEFNDTAAAILAVRLGLPRVEALLASGLSLRITKDTVNYLPHWSITAREEILDNLKVILSSPSATIDEDGFIAFGGRYGSGVIDVMLLSQHYQLMTPRMLQTVASFGNANCLTIALEQFSGDPNVEDLFVAALSAASRVQQDTVEMLVLRFPNQTITERLLLSAAKNGDGFQTLFARSTDQTVTERLLVALLPSHFSLDFIFTNGYELKVKCTPELLQALASYSAGEGVFKHLLLHPEALSIEREGVVELGRIDRDQVKRSNERSWCHTYRCCAPPHLDCQAFMEKFIRGPDISAIQNAACCIASAFPGNLTALMFSRQDLSLSVTDELFNAVAVSGHDEAMRLLLARPRELSQRSMVGVDLSSAAERFGAETVKLIMEYYPELSPTEDVVFAATRNTTSTASVLMAFLLSQCPVSESTLPNLFEHAVSNKDCGYKVAEAILTKYFPFDFTERTLEIVAGHPDCVSLLQLLANHKAHMQISESIFRIAAGTQSNAFEVLKILFFLMPSQLVTEGIVIALLERNGVEDKFNFSHDFGRQNTSAQLKALPYLLDQHLDPTLAMSEKLIMAARASMETAQCLEILVRKIPCVSPEAILLILEDCSPSTVDVLIDILQMRIIWCPELLKALSQNYMYMSPILLSLFRREQQALRPEIAALADIVPKHFNSKAVEAFLYRFWQGPLLPSMIAAIMENSKSDVSSLHVLLEYDPSITFTETNLISAIKSRKRCNFIEVILEHGDEDIITSKVMQVARRYAGRSFGIWRDLRFLYAGSDEDEEEQDDKTAKKTGNNQESIEVLTRDALLNLFAENDDPWSMHSWRRRDY